MVISLNKKYILFDLDGTVTDSREGITRCVEYALESFGIKENNMSELLNYIGPPLIESFQNFHGLNEKQALQAVDKYRERYRDTGIYENKLFDGMYDCIRQLKSEGKCIALATCKPEIFAKRIIEYFKLSEYFDVVAGSSLDSSRRYKNEVIEEAFSRLMNAKGYTDKDSEEYKEILNEMKADAVMVGDRKDDVEGAQKCHIESVGVRFGFANDNELENAGVDYIVDTPAELLELLQNSEQ